MVFNGIEEGSIDRAENFVSSKLLKILEATAERNGQTLETKEKSLFFGKFFVSEPSEFKFTLGERILINQIKQHVHNKGFKYFTAKKRKLNEMKLAETAVGFIFGESENSEDSEDKLHAKSASHGKSISSSENIEEKLLISANKVTNKQLWAIGDTTNSILTADMIEIVHSENDSIKGYVQCVFCKENRKVSYKNASGNWVMSNLISHLKKCSQQLANKKKEANKSDQRLAKETEKISEGVNVVQLVGEQKKNCLDGNKQMVNFKITPEVPTDDIRTTNLDSPQKHVFLSDNFIRQMSLQNIKMRNTIAKNETIIIERNFRANIQNLLSDMSIKVCQIPADGNCLFHAVCHQLNRLEIASDQHKTLMEKLRMDVVQHIENNIAAYEFIMKDRIYHKNPGIKIISLEKEIKSFLERSLSKDGTWGGNESLHAISTIHKKNIVIINETDDPNMILKFNPDYNESIMIFLNSDRYHYESVVNVDFQVISAIAVELIEKQTKPNFIQGVTYEIEDD